MVDHWPVSTVLSEDEQHIIKEHREGNLMYLSDAEKEMVKGFRIEQEIIINEKNEKSANQRALEELDRLRKHIQPYEGFFFHHDSKAIVDRACEIHDKNEERLNLIASWDHKYLNTYQNKAAETAIYPGNGTPLGLIYCALKLCGEAGEVSENVGKALRDDNIVTYYPGSRTGAFYEMKDDRRNKLKLELGDVLWYVSQTAKELGFTLEEIAEENLSKLASRKERGTLKGSGDER